jgi:hypothetical protein
MYVCRLDGLLRSKSSRRRATSMSQHLFDPSTSQLVSGTEAMDPGAGGAHTRALQLFVPAFASRPDITISIYSPEDSIRTESYPQFDPNPGHPFVQWAIGYVPSTELGYAKDEIMIHATNTVDGVANNYLYLCSYVVVGTKA